MPLDQYQRQIDYLRISVIDRCNLRCRYCMPINGLRFLEHSDLLSPAEIAAVAEVAVSVGFRKFRLTGGEPMLRQDLIEIVERLRDVEGAGELAMTTNGILLPQLAAPLAAAGLKLINIHLDSMHPERLQDIMRWGQLNAVHKGIEAAEQAGLVPIKINAVVARGLNDADVVDMARLTLSRDWHVRFIEMMPIGEGECAGFARQQYISNEEIKVRIESELGRLMPIAGSAADESRNYRFADARGVVGFISPVSAPYCGSCNRMRLTADGKLHLCLLNDDEMDIRKQLREQGPDAVRAVLLKAVHLKPMGHRLREGIFTQNRRMFQIGG